MSFFHTTIQSASYFPALTANANFPLMTPRTFAFRNIHDFLSRIFDTSASFFSISSSVLIFFCIYLFHYLIVLNFLFVMLQTHVRRPASRIPLLLHLLCIYFRYAFRASQDHRVVPHQEISGNNHMCRLEYWNSYACQYIYNDDVYQNTSISRWWGIFFYFMSRKDPSLLIRSKSTFNANPINKKSLHWDDYTSSLIFWLSIYPLFRKPIHLQFFAFPPLQKKCSTVSVAPWAYKCIN